MVVLSDCQQKNNPRMKYKEGKLFPSSMFQTLQWYSTTRRVKFEPKVPHHLAPACLSPLDSSGYEVYGASSCFSFLLSLPSQIVFLFLSLPSTQMMDFFTSSNFSESFCKLQLLITIPKFYLTFLLV